MGDSYKDTGHKSYGRIGQTPMTRSGEPLYPERDEYTKNHRQDRGAVCLNDHHANSILDTGHIRNCEILMKSRWLQEGIVVALRLLDNRAA
jgi:hypothetical protein